MHITLKGFNDPIISCHTQATKIPAQNQAAHSGRIRASGAGRDTKGTRRSEGVLQESRLRRVEDHQPA